MPGLADEALARWVAEGRQSPAPPARKAGVRALRKASALRAAARPREPVLPLVQDLALGEGPGLRLYRAALEPRPLVLYFHGGYFVMGGLDSHDSICRRLAHTADLAVLAVDYRLAPEHPWPAGVDDAVRAYGWARSRTEELGGAADAGVGLAGDSAGGAIALLAAVQARDQGTPASALLLAYPNADLTLSMPSVRTEGRGWGLEADDLRWAVRQWVPDPGLRADPRVSPVHADLAGLPPALVATAERDPLRDEGDALSRRMHEARVPVAHVRHPGLVHGFLGLADVSPAAGQASQELFRRFGQIIRVRPPAGRRT